MVLVVCAAAGWLLWLDPPEEPEPSMDSDGAARLVDGEAHRTVATEARDPKPSRERVRPESPHDAAARPDPVPETSDAPWAGLTLRLPRPVLGELVLEVLPSFGGKAARVRRAIDAAELAPTVVLQPCVSGDAELVSVYAGDDRYAVRAENIELELFEGEFVEVAPWRGQGVVDLVLDGAPPEVAQAVDLQLECLSTVDETAVAAWSCARLSRGAWRFGSLAEGSYLIRVHGVPGEFEIDDVKVDLAESSLSQRVTLAARSVSQLVIRTPDGGSVEIYDRASGAFVDSVHDEEEHTMRLVVGSYRVVFTDGFGRRQERMVELGARPEELWFR